MKLKRATVMELRIGMGRISETNKANGFPLYNLGFKAHYAMARTIERLKPVMEKIDQRQQEAAGVLRALDEEEALKKRGIPNAAPTLSEYAAKRKAINDEWLAYLQEEEEVELFKFSAAGMTVAKEGQETLMPSPEVLNALLPMMEE